MSDFLPYFQARCADVFMLDVAWMGFSQSKKVGDLAQIFEFNVAPHNYYSHLSTFISASLCAVQNGPGDQAGNEANQCTRDPAPRGTPWR